MPNHVHAFLFPTHAGTSLNKLVGEGKRFMAYDIVNNLKKAEKDAILKTLEQGVEAKEKLKGKKHQVFRLSFDARKCFKEQMIEQMLDYIHRNLYERVKWNLAEDYTKYPHSSAQFYEFGMIGDFEITHYKDLNKPTK